MPPTPTDGLRPDALGARYEVLAELGAGGFGTVYLVYSHETGEILAAKTPIGGPPYPDGLSDRFRLEAETWVELAHHPHVVRAHYAEEVLGRWFLFMEYVPRPRDGLHTLADFVDAHSDLPRLLRLAVHACRGLEHAFSCGLACHRDIKPGNILVGDREVAKVTDFGLAKLDSVRSDSVRGFSDEGLGRPGVTRAGTALGTLPFMAPEQFEDASLSNERSDIYAFGVTLFQIAFGGRLPFLPRMADSLGPSDDTTAWYLLHRFERPALAPSPLTHIIARCLSKTPTDRYHEFAEMRVDLEAVFEGVSGSPAPIESSKVASGGDWANKGNTLSRLGHLERALPCYETAVSLEPNNPWIWSDVASCYLTQDRVADGLYALDRALALDSREPYALMNKALCLAQLGFTKEAQSYARRAATLAPESDTLAERMRVVQALISGLGEERGREMIPGIPISGRRSASAMTAPLACPTAGCPGPEDKVPITVALALAEDRRYAGGKPFSFSCDVCGAKKQFTKADLLARLPDAARPHKLPLGQAWALVLVPVEVGDDEDYRVFAGERILVQVLTEVRRRWTGRALTDSRVAPTVTAGTSISGETLAEYLICRDVTRNNAVRPISVEGVPAGAVARLYVGSGDDLVASTPACGNPSCSYVFDLTHSEFQASIPANSPSGATPLSVLTCEICGTSIVVSEDTFRDLVHI